MALVHILDHGVERDVDAASLVRTDGVLDNAHERTTWTEYRFPHSDTIVHRSAHVALKQWPDGLTGVVQSFGS